jgi:nucleotide-binding universal stress UspA family protein
MIRKILIPLDGSELSARVLLPVRKLLSSQKVGVVTLLHVVEEDSDDEQRAAGEAVLAKAQGDLSKAGIPVSLRMAEGGPATCIGEVAEELKPDLVAMATHGRSGVDRWVRGSVAERVLRTCTRPVLLLKPFALDEAAADKAFRKILVPWDGSDTARAVLPWAAEVARVYGSEILLFRVENFAAPDGGSHLRLRTPDEIVEALAPAVAELVAEGISARGVAALGSAPVEILDTAEREGVDLIAMTTHGRSGFSRWWFGSTAETVLRHSEVPLLVLRSTEE